jgi:putative transcriptional regulator
MRPVLALLLLLMPPALPCAAAAAETAASLTGQLLVAEPSLDDPNFDRTLVLMLRHDGDGALGLVVNRPYGKAPTAELLRRLGRETFGPVEGETLLFYGGPVAPEVGMVVHSAEYARADTRPVAAGIAVTGDPACLADLASGRGPSRAVPVLGYAGWAPGQLESELAQGSWFTLPADPELVFAADPGKAWAEAVARKGVDL